MAETIGEALDLQDEFYRRFAMDIKNNLRVSIPGIIQEFDSATQTATVQIALRERIRNNDLSVAWRAISPLLDVPVMFPRAGNFVITFPVQSGDECLVVFADMCIDAWFSNAGVQNQIEKRRHDLSDGIAILGLWSQPNKLSSISGNSLQIKTLDGSTMIEVKEDTINLNANKVYYNGNEVATVP